ncbi:MAG: discoidin domain-containing protein [Phycisphaerales bacterium]
MLLLAVVVALLGVGAGEPLLSDEFGGVGDWRGITADGVGLVVSSDPNGLTGACLRLDYDFTRGSGYAIVRREFERPIDLPANHALTFMLKGEGPRNTLEVKLVERAGEGGGAASAENVWWVNQRGYAFAGPWRPVRLPKRKFSFAWGPGPRASASRIDAIEIVVTSFDGGRGTVWLDDLRLDAVPEVKPYEGTPRIEVSSRAVGEGPLSAADDGTVGWRSRSAVDDPEPSATVDLGQIMELGGLVLSWEPDLHAKAYGVQGSIDGQTWTALAEVRRGNGGDDELVLPDTSARYIRLHSLVPASAEGVGLRALTVLPPEFAEDSNARLRLIAERSPRGWWPRYWLGEASFWTVVGVPDDDREALISEDGVIELAKSGPSLEPFVRSGGRLLTWNLSSTTQHLAEGYLPIPTVTRELADQGGEVGLRLEVTCFVDDTPPFKAGEGVLFIRYRLSNTCAGRRSGSLYLAGRPVQVNPTYQLLNTPGGSAVVGRCGIDARGISIGDCLVIPLTKPSAFGACAIEEGEIIEHLAAGGLPQSTSADDPSGYASCAAEFVFSLDAGEEVSVVLLSPLHGRPVPSLGGERTGDRADDLFEARLAAVGRAWKARLNRVEIDLPPEGRRMWDIVRSNLGYILINADRAAIQPGSRSYERSWIRDGALTSAAMLAFGLGTEAEAFVDWYAPNQYESGKVPCAVDRRGPDPVPEHDSDGEFIFAVMNSYRHTGDAGFLRRHWDGVRRAAVHIERLRAGRLTDEFCSPGAPVERRALCGLLPESISHEGYSAKPMHSYWDDFWCLRGLGDAAEVALIVGDEAEASRLRVLRDAFERSVGESIRLVMQSKGIEYIPGCAELGDFDATSTTVGIWPCLLRGGTALPEEALVRTFERYWSYFEDRRAARGAAADWINYTPYEWRTVGAMIHLGVRGDEAWRERSRLAAAYFLADARPSGFNHWAEVVWRDPRTPRFIGDMPHTWCGSDFINSFRAMFVLEMNDALVVGAGLPLEWIKEGVRVRGLRTVAGLLSFAVRADAENGHIHWDIDGGLDLPSGGLWVAPPAASRIGAARVNGEAVEVSGGLINVDRVPCRIELEYRP